MVKTKKYKNGEVYVGKIRGGKREYYGHHHWPDKGDYVGEWNDDMMNGLGKYTWLDGRTFQGFFVNDMMCGRGCYQERNQTKEIFGEFTNGVLNGRGVQFTKTPDNKGYHVLVGTEFSSGKLIRGVEFIVMTEGGEDKITELKQYKKNPGYAPVSSPLSRTISRVGGDVDASNSLPPTTPRVDTSTTQNSSSMIEHVEFMEKQRYMDAKKEMQEKQKAIVLDFQNKLLALEDKLKEERQNAQFKTKCQQLEAELATFAQKAEESKQQEQQLLQQVQQQRKLFEAFELESNRHNKAMGDHINDLEQKLTEQTQEFETKLKESSEKLESDLATERSKATDLEQEIATLKSQTEELENKHRSDLELIEQEKQQLNDQLKQVEESKQEQDTKLEENQKTIEDLSKKLEEHTLMLKSHLYDGSRSPRTPRSSSATAQFAKKLFAKDGEGNEEFNNLRTKLSRQPVAEGDVVVSDNGPVQIDFRSVLKNKVENKPDWIK